MADEVINIAQINLVPDIMDQDEPTMSLDHLSTSVVEGFEIDWDSRRQWMESNEMWMDLALQFMEHKTWPWPNAANIKFPLISMAALAFQSRVYPIMVHGTNLVRCKPVGGQSSENHQRAKRVANHMNWQLLEQMTSWEEETDRLLFVVPIIGTMFRKTYFDPLVQRNVSDTVMPSELVINYQAKSIHESPRITHLLFMQEHEVKSNIAAGVFDNLTEDDLKGSSLSPSRVKDRQDEKDKRAGLEAPRLEDLQAVRTHCFLEQHTRFDLDGDGYAEPVIVTVHYASKKVVRITNNQLLSSLKLDFDGKTIIKVDPIPYFTKYGFIPNPDSGIYDLGFGQLAGPMNKAINTLLNQLIDSGTIHNIQGGFLARGIKLKKGEAGFVPGEWKQTQVAPADLAQSFFALPTREPSHVLLQLLTFLVDTGQRLTSTMDAMMGENPGQNQPAATTMAVMEQGMKVFQSIFKRIHRAFKQEFKILFRLNGEYLDDQEYFVTSGAQDSQEDATVLRSDYDPSFMSVVPYSDPSVVSATSKLIRVRALGELLSLETINRTEYTKRFLEAIEEPDIEALITLPPAGPSEKLQLLQLQLEFDRWKTEIQEGNKAKQIESEGVKDQAVAILAMAKAQSEEVNRQIKELQAQLGGLSTLVKAAATPAPPDLTPEPAAPEIGATETDMAPTSEAVTGEPL